MTAPTIGEVRQALSDAVTNSITGIVGYETVPDRIEVPCIVVEPAECDYLVGGGNCQVWMYTMFVMVARTETRANQTQLDAFLSAHGDKSIPAALKVDDTLGLDACDATLIKMTGYGGERDGWAHRDGGVPHIGAMLHVKVIITE